MKCCTTLDKQQVNGKKITEQYEYVPFLICRFFFQKQLYLGLIMTCKIVQP